MEAAPLIDFMKSFPDSREVTGTRALGEGLVTYAVTQGRNILTIGSGEAKRLKTLMGNKGSHNKAPVVGLCNRIFQEPLRFFVCRYTPFPDGRRASVEERSLQARFGTLNIDGITSYAEAMRTLRKRLNLQDDQVESILLDLMETHGDVLNHALSTPSTAGIVEALFGGYWKRANRRF